MEHFWAILKHNVKKNSTPPREIEELWERMCNVSSSFNEEDCMVLYESMPQRIVVLATKGYWMDY